jgi:hypothetical protein
MPQTIVEHHHEGRTGHLVARLELATEHRSQAEMRERTGRHEIDWQPLGDLPIVAHAERRARVRVEAREAADRVAQAPVVGVGEAGDPSLPVLRPDRHDAVGIGERQAAQADGVDEREEEAVRADPEREHEDRGRGHRRLSPQHPRRDSDVREEGVHRRHAALVPVALLDRVRLTERTARRQTRRGRRHPAALELLGQQLEMVTDLLIDPILAPPPDDDAAKPDDPFAPATHEPASSSRAISSTVCRHNRSSAASCRRPVRVML